MRSSNVVLRDAMGILLVVAPVERNSSFPLYFEIQMLNCDLSGFSKLHNLSDGSLQDWMRLYDGFGLKGLSESKSHQTYSSELKQKAVHAYLSGEGSARRAQFFIPIIL